MKAAIRNTELYFDIAGMQLVPQGHTLLERPVLFLLHGGPGGDHLRFKQHSLELEKVAQLVFIDHRGCGRSKKTRQSDYTLENNIEDIEALRKYLGLQKISILGTSYGGMVAQGYAIRYPQNLDKLILVVTAPSHHALDEAKKNLLERGTNKQIAMAEPVWKGTFRSPKHVQEYFKVMENLYSIKTKKKTQRPKKSLTTWSHEALNEFFGGVIRRMNFIPKLKKITCPTLVLAGEKDWICPPSQSKIIAKNIPHATLHILKNCGHSMAMDAHERYIQLITAFLTKKPSTRKGRRTSRSSTKR